MSNQRFNPRETERPQVSPFGDVYRYAGQCAACDRNVFTVEEENGRHNEPDPRGFAGPRHSLATFEKWPSVKFCWDCVNEHDSEGYSRCRALAEHAAAVCAAVHS